MGSERDRITELFERDAGKRTTPKKVEEKIRKTFKNLLTMEGGCDILTKLSPNGAADSSLKIEQQRNVLKDSENSFEFKEALTEVIEH